MKGASPLMSSARNGVGRDDWGTPVEVLDCVRRVAPIVLDPCSGPNSVLRAPVSWDGSSIKVDGLRRNWSTPFRDADGLAFINYPYSAANAWAEKIADEAGHRVPMIVLCPARTDTRAWRAMVAHADAIAFWRGRIRFLVDGEPGGTAPFPSALLAFNLSHRRLRAAFDGVCDVVIPT